MKKSLPLAIIDMGSNSFRLMIGHFEAGEFIQTDYLKETVRQGALDEQGNITPDAFERGLICLTRFKERLGNIEPQNTRAIATHTLREATNRNEFMRQAQQVLGIKIEVISGDEEARLVFSGVTHLLPQSSQYRTAIDIGGRSTELVSGQHTEAAQTVSMAIGSVSATQKYFADGQITQANLDRALTGLTATFSELFATYNPYMSAGEVWGCSGTIGAIHTILVAHNRSDNISNKISKDDMRWFIDQLLEAKTIENLKLDGLKTERQPIFIGGFMILYSIFTMFKLSAVYSAEGALRHGIAYDWNERTDQNACRRQNTIASLVKKFKVDVPFSQIMQQSTQLLCQQLGLTLADSHNQENEDIATQIELCTWAGELSELGAIISHDDLHKHGAYIVQHSPLIGFYESEKIRLGQLLSMSRGKLKPHSDALKNPTLALQVFVLRTALALCNTRLAPNFNGFSCLQTNQGFSISVTAQWVKNHPQTMFLLQEEVSYWAKTDRSLVLERS